MKGDKNMKRLFMCVSVVCGLCCCCRGDMIVTNTVVVTNWAIAYSAVPLPVQLVDTNGVSELSSAGASWGEITYWTMQGMGVGFGLVGPVVIVMMIRRGLNVVGGKGDDV